MERFAVIIGLFIAGGFAIAAMTGHQDFAFEIDTDEGSWHAAAPVSADQIVNMTETAFAANALQTVDAAVLLQVIPEDRADVSVSITNAGPLATPLVRLEGATLVIDGALGARVHCRGDGDVTVHGRGSVALAQLPVVRVRTPRAVNLDGVGGGGLVRVGEAQDLRLTVSGCGDADIAAVAGALTLRAEGSGDIEVEQAREAEIELTGSGDVSFLRPVSRLQVTVDGSSAFEAPMAPGAAAVLTLNGSGDIRISGGPLSRLQAQLDGSGDIDVDAAVTGPATAHISGSGDIDIGGTVDSLNAAVEGSGSVDVAGVRGAQTRVVRGSGEITVDEAAPPLPPVPPAPPVQPQSPPRSAPAAPAPPAATQAAPPASAAP